MPYRSNHYIRVRVSTLGLIFLVMSLLPGMPITSASGTLATPIILSTKIDIVGPSGSDRFGATITVLSNGNFVVTDPTFDLTSPSYVPSVGAVYLYNGATGALISMLTGSSAVDLVGVGGVTALSNGNYVISSPLWNNGAAGSAGAVTWGDGNLGVSGIVSASNSLVGSSLGDEVGGGVTALANGNYVVASPGWSNGAVTAVGAATWGNGATGIKGPVSPSNSLTGSSQTDLVGLEVKALANGNYVVLSSSWNNGAITGVGAVTWGNGATGVKGVVSASNSLVGTTQGDFVGSNDVTLLTNSNYVVRSVVWHNGGIAAGAATWGSGTTGVKGPVSSANSLVGSSDGDIIGGGVTALANGNYVVFSADWDNGAIKDAGAAAWGNGATGTSGVISAANSLVGTAQSELVASRGVTALTNGNYVVNSPGWSNGAVTAVGAATWGNGATGISGPISPSNSLVGSSQNDFVGTNTAALTNGNYVVSSPTWANNGVTNAGAATWGNGATGVKGSVSSANSLVGTSTGDGISSQGITALTNGNYVVNSPFWNNGAVLIAGAVTWGNGATGIRGMVSAASSLTGSAPGDQIGLGGVSALTNGNYVVSSWRWDDGAIVNAGAVTWCNGKTGTSGLVSAANSLVGDYPFAQVGKYALTTLNNGNYVVKVFDKDNDGIAQAGSVTWGNGATGSSGVISTANSLVGSTAEDSIGSGGVFALSNGNYVVSSPMWNTDVINDAGAITYGLGSSGLTVGPVTPGNSVIGTVTNAGNAMVFNYDNANRQLIVGQPASHVITLFRITEFDVCLQDDGNPNTSLAFNSQTGEYVFCCNGTQFAGKGTVTPHGNTYTLTDSIGNHRLQATVDAGTHHATASYQRLGSGAMTCTLTDRDTRNDACPCVTH